MECWLMTCQTCTRKLWPVKIKLFLPHFWQSTHGGHFPSRNYTAFFWSIVSYGTCEEKHFDEFPWPYVQDHEHTHMSNNSIFSLHFFRDRNYCCNVMVLSKDIFIWQFFKRIFLWIMWTFTSECARSWSRIASTSPMNNFCIDHPLR